MTAFNRVALGYRTPQASKCCCTFEARCCSLVLCRAASLVLTHIHGSKSGSVIEVEFTRSLVVSQGINAHATNFSDGAPAMYVCIAKGPGEFDPHETQPLYVWMSTSTLLC